MATKKTTKRTRAHSTKTVDEVTNSLLGAEPEDETVTKVRAARKAKAVSDSATITIEKVTQSLTKAGLDITKTLSGVRELFESEISALDTISEAIEAKKEELEELFDKETVASSLRDLVLKNEAYKADWEKNMNGTRDTWLKEQADHRTQVSERDAVLAKERKREEEDFEYNKSIRRRNEEEIWRSTIAQRQREQRETEEALEKTWKEREEVLKKAEAAIAENKNKLDNFDTIVSEAVQKDVQIITDKIKADFETQAKIKTLEFESEKKLLDHDNRVLKSLVADRDKEIQKLREALDKKDTEVKEVAVAAMEAQSGRAALAAVQEHAQSQNKK